MLSVIINLLEIKDFGYDQDQPLKKNLLENILKPFPGDNYQYIFITSDPILKGNIVSNIDTSFNILHFTDSIISALSLLNENEEFIIHECKYLFYLYIDNFLWYTKINKCDILKITHSSKYVGFNYYKNLNIFIDKNHIENNEYEITNIYDINYKGGENILINTVKKIECKAVFQPHWGWTDYIILIGLIEYYKKQFQELYIIGFYAHKESLEHLYKDVNFYYIDVPLCTLLNDYLHRSDCGNTNANISLLDLIPKLFDEDYLFIIDGHQCSQDFSVHFNTLNLSPHSTIQNINKNQLKNTAFNFKNELINPSNINLIHKIKILSMNNNNNIYDERLLFYTLAHLDQSMIIDEFKIYNTSEENKLYNDVIQSIGNNYMVVHHLENMNIENPKDYAVYLLNDKSNKIVDLLKIIENAKEIHVYDSLYGTLIYLLYFSSTNFCRNIPIYIHKYARKKIANFYNYELIQKSNDWHILLD